MSECCVKWSTTKYGPGWRTQLDRSARIANTPVECRALRGSVIANLVGICDHGNISGLRAGPPARPLALIVYIASIREVVADHPVSISSKNCSAGRNRVTVPNGAAPPVARSAAIARCKHSAVSA